jgi:hypothetical protein
MPTRLLEQLARREVPPAPAELNSQVHRRLNRALLAAHLVDLAVGCLPYLALHFLRAVADFFKATFTGRFESDRRDPPRQAP